MARCIKYAVPLSDMVCLWRRLCEELDLECFVSREFFEQDYRSLSILDERVTHPALAEFCRPCDETWRRSLLVVMRPKNSTPPGASARSLTSIESNSIFFDLFVPACAGHICFEVYIPKRDIVPWEGSEAGGPRVVRKFLKTIAPIKVYSDDGSDFAWCSESVALAISENVGCWHLSPRHRFRE